MHNMNFYKLDFQKSFATHKWGKMYMMFKENLHFIIQEKIKM